MTRDQNERFEQDRLGNVNRRLDDVRAQGGMSDSNGLVDVTQDGSNLILYEIPEDVSQVNIDEVHAHNGLTSDGTFNIHSATLDADGNIATTTRRSVPLDVTAENTRIHSYTGEEFSEDAIVVSADFDGTIGVGVYVDRPEEYEPFAEQEESPG